MSAILHVVDAFTDRAFYGNPAAVCLLEGPRDDGWMQLLAREMNLAETSFLHPIEAGWSLRWLTPTVEVALCGHATLAAAFVLWQTGVLAKSEPARFLTLSGWLTCRWTGEAIEMDFPVQPVTPCPVPTGLTEALGCEVLAVAKGETDYLVEVAGEGVLRSLRPDLRWLAANVKRGWIVTCRSESPEYDFISRFFAPAAGVDEDPVTGSAHCTLGPYWQAKLGRDTFTAYQASARGGVVKVNVRGDRVFLTGKAVMISRVELLV
ncbi:MAG TPA: PhzF family phenazine biosynthesis protein [Chthoniobacterales bacterium]|jgi:predicted PhzF superfamily epimerase YddE/YHI9